MSKLAPEDNMPPDLTSQVSEKLKLASLCVSGSFGVVHRCTIETSEGTTEVAVKVFKIDLGRAVEKNEKAIRRELLVWFRLKHRTIVPLLGTALIESPFPALVSKWMPSGTLYVYLEEATILTASAKVELAKGVADGLQYLHSENVVHGDLHPANVLIDYSGNPRLIDFGLATVVGDAELQLSITTASRSLDPRWRAPEVIGIDPDLDPERPTFTSDIYSFGGIMFFVISGERPWKKKQPHHIYVELSNKANPARPDNILDNHWDLIQRCWSWNPKDRPRAIEVFESICITGSKIEDKQPNPHDHASTSQGQLKRRRSSPYALPPLSRGRTYNQDICPSPFQSTKVDYSPGQDVELRRMETYHDSRQQSPASLFVFNAPTPMYAWERDEPESQICHPQPLYTGQNLMRSSSSSSISSLRDSSRMPSPALSDLGFPTSNLPPKIRRSSSSSEHSPYRASSVTKIMEPLRHVNIEVDHSWPPVPPRPHQRAPSLAEMFGIPPLHKSHSDCHRQREDSPSASGSSDQSHVRTRPTTLQKAESEEWEKYAYPNTGLPPPPAHGSVTNLNLSYQGSPSRRYSSEDWCLQPQPAASTSQDLPRRKKACRQCRAIKVRCDSTTPACHNCVRRSIECKYDAAFERRRRDKRILV